MQLQRFGLRRPDRQSVGGHGPELGRSLDGDAGSIRRTPTSRSGCSAPAATVRCRRPIRSARRPRPATPRRPARRPPRTRAALRAAAAVRAPASSPQISRRARSRSQGALSTATQDHPSNTNVSIRVLSPGDDGSVSQANTVGSTATSGNSASTSRTPRRRRPAAARLWLRHRSGAAGDRGPAGRRDRASHDGRREPVERAGSSANAGNLGSTGQNASQNTSGTGIQTGDQSAGTDQSAIALSSAKQIDPSNTAGSIRVLSPGDDGSVTQANTVGSTATSGNSADDDAVVDPVAGRFVRLQPADPE